MIDFKVGQTSLDVCKIILTKNKKIMSVRLIAHEVGLNWRQRCRSREDKLKFLEESFNTPLPLRELILSRDEFLDLELGDLPGLGKNQVWSMTSKVEIWGGGFRHIPMMNFHVAKEEVGVARKVIAYIFGESKGGAILESGRFLHFYGGWLLNEGEWIKFMSRFLMPVFLVSPRYIGHSFYDGYASLRLSRDRTYKRKIPKVIEIV